MIEQKQKQQSDNRETLHLNRKEAYVARDRVRTPFTRRSVLDVPEIPGYHQEWVETTLGNVDDHLARGYEFVTGEVESPGQESQLGSTVERIVNKDPNATCKTNVLMKIKEEWYQEDLRALHQAGYDALKQIDPKRNSNLHSSGNYASAKDDQGNDYNFYNK